MTQTPKSTTIASPVDRLFSLAAAYSRMGVVANDLEFVRECCAKMLDPQIAADATAVRAFALGAAVTYVRCFQTNRRRIGLRQELVRRLPENCDDIHSYVFRVRHRHLAHADAEEPMEVQEVYVLTEVRNADGKPIAAHGIALPVVKWIAFDPAATEQLRNLVTKLHADQTVALQRLSMEINQLAQTLSPDELEEVGRRQKPQANLGIPRESQQRSSPRPPI